MAGELIIIPRAVGHAGGQAGVAFRVFATQNLGLGHGKLPEFGERQINATAPGVLTNVPDDVGHLKCEAKVFCINERFVVPKAEDGRGQLSDHAGNPVAVEFERLEILVAMVREVHLHAVNDFVQAVLINTKLDGCLLQGLCYWMPGVAGEQVGHLRSPPRELGPSDSNIRHFVGNIVDLATKRIQRGNGPASICWKESEAVIKA